MEDEVLDYGPEGFIPLPWGGELRFPPYELEETPSYVRVIRPNGTEVAYWHVDEWAEDPGLVMGAILGAMQHG